jgi:predicted phosphodiesterase
MLKILHTADWHLGLRFPSFKEADQPKLTRARLDVVERIFGVAERHEVDAVLCAGDLFDSPEPATEWWQGLARCIERAGWSERPLILLPGNHDPLLPGSVWSPAHPFRQQLPDWVKVVDRDDFSCRLGANAMVLATPCRSRAGDHDPTRYLPKREPGDERLRIGLVHGQTFDIDGHQTNFPIAREAAHERGLDYLALGDTHSFREVDSTVPTVYPGSPEPTKLREPEAGHVVLALFRRRRRPPIIQKERVGHWTWHEQTCRDLASLRALASSDKISSWVLRLVLEMNVSLPELHQVEVLLDQLGGTAATHNRAGVLQLDRSGLTVSASGEEDFPAELPAVLKTVVKELQAARGGDRGEAKLAERALWHLYRLVAEG